MEWQPIETAPEVKGDYFWCQLAWGPEDDQSTGNGFRFDGEWYAAGCFHRLGKQRKFGWREVEVKPTHWMPTQPPPSAA